MIILAISGFYLWLTHALASQQTFDSRKQQQQLWSDEVLKATVKEFTLVEHEDKNITTAYHLQPSLKPIPAVDTPPWQLKKYYIAAADTNTGNMVKHPTLNRNIEIHNDFHYEVNISNQANYSYNNEKQPTSSLSNSKDINSSTELRTSKASNTFLSSSTVPIESESDITNITSSSPSSSYFERVELQESLMHTKSEKLLLHRNKRYLLFPEGSSLQLVFDLIIPIVDYTNFAIMGITCAVAWELPSKPPSEIIENFRTKLNDGTFGIIRRNDSTQQSLEYIDSQRTEQDTEEDNKGWNGGIAISKANVYNPNYLLYQQQQLSETVATKSPLLPQLPLSASNNFHYNRNSIPLEKFQQPTKTTFFYNQLPAQQKWSNYNDFRRFDANQRKILYNNNDRKVPIYRKHYFTSSQPNNNYRVYSAANKLNVKNWQTKKKYLYPQYLQQQQQQPQQTKIPYNDAGDYWNKDNWWDRKRNRKEEQRQENQHKWSLHYQENEQSYQTPMLNKRTARNRKILDKPPKHRIYPIFGKRRRRRSSTHTSDDEFVRKLQDIHTREHFQTRQKLYGKIEKLYKTRGQNGTACVLRAICETEKIHLNVDHHKTPQSFVLEVLRSIFALPKDILTDPEDSSLQLDVRYINAVLVAHDTTQNCSKQYFECEYSITYGT